MIEVRYKEGKPVGGLSKKKEVWLYNLMAKAIAMPYRVDIEEGSVSIRYESVKDLETEYENVGG